MNDFLKLNVSALIKHKDGWPFDRPISKSEVPDYHLHVKHPMDLGTIKYGDELRDIKAILIFNVCRTRLNDMVYQKDQQVIDDIRLVFNNCYSVRNQFDLIM